MIKIITLITKFILVLLTALLFCFCNYNLNFKVNQGNVTTENRAVTDDFKSIEVANAIDLVVEQSDKASITVEADDNLINGITTNRKWRFNY
jgi:hypothetical protein